MKRLIIYCLTILTICCAAAAAAESNPVSAEIAAAIAADPVQLQTWGDTAACFAEKDGVKRLIVLEKQEGGWRIVIDNPTALIQDTDWPELLPDSDNAIFWTYRLSEQETLRYHSTRGTDGLWGPVDQYFTDSRSDRDTYAWSTMWDEAHGGEIIRSFAIMDENDNMVEGSQIQFFPAMWMGDRIRLAVFDLTYLPGVFGAPVYGFWFETDRFYRDAAATLLPDCTYIDGLLKDGALHFLVQKPNGDKVYVICEYESRREVNIIESSPLPADTKLGRDNFTDSLWINPLCVPIRLMDDRETMGIEYIYKDTARGDNGGFLFFGDRTVWTDTVDDMILYGDHPWNDVRKVDWNTLPGNISEASEKMDAGHYAVVANPNPADRLHLRERADRDSRSIGKYYSGTPVTVLAEEGDWALVAVGSGKNYRRGYMMKKFLTFGEAGKALLLDTSAMPQLLSKSEMLKVYDEPQTGRYVFHTTMSMMKVIGIIGNEWYHVWFPDTGEYGFVLQNDLWEGNG